MAGNKPSCPLVFSSLPRMQEVVNWSKLFSFSKKTRKKRSKEVLESNGSLPENRNLGQIKKLVSCVFGSRLNL